MVGRGALLQEGLYFKKKGSSTENTVPILK